jgi:hypothetical protein
VNWGRGDLIHIGNLQGTIIGVMKLYLTSSFGHSVGKLVIKTIIGDEAKTIGEYVCAGTSYFEGNKFVADDKLHFAFEMARDGGYIHGAFSVDASPRRREDQRREGRGGGGAGEAHERRTLAQYEQDGDERVHGAVRAAHRLSASHT